MTLLILIKNVVVKKQGGKTLKLVGDLPANMKFFFDNTN
jgi:hypothetical protein